MNNSTSTPLCESVILYDYSFSSDPHAWSAAPVQLNWTCLYTNVVYKIANLLIFPEVTLQLTLHDNRATTSPTVASSGLNLSSSFINYRTSPPLIVGIKLDTSTSIVTSAIYTKHPETSRNRPLKLKIVLSLCLPHC